MFLTAFARCITKVFRLRNFGFKVARSLLSFSRMTGDEVKAVALLLLKFKFSELVATLRVYKLEEPELAAVALDFSLSLEL